MEEVANHISRSLKAQHHVPENRDVVIAFFVLFLNLPLFVYLSVSLSVCLNRDSVMPAASPCSEPPRLIKSLFLSPELRFQFFDTLLSGLETPPVPER